MEVEIREGLAARIEVALDTMRPFLKADGGDVELLEITDDMIVRLRLLGQCRACSMSAMTMKAGIEDGIRRTVPEVRQVVAVSEE